MAHPRAALPCIAQEILPLHPTKLLISACPMQHLCWGETSHSFITCGLATTAICADLGLSFVLKPLGSFSTCFP